MWRRMLLAAAAVSYLICVLIMSGMQKEDLDVSMLRKLQRYNVNFDDINNEEIRQQCSSRNNGFTTGDQTYKTEEGYVSTTEYQSSITTKKSLPPVTLNMDSVINYLKTRGDSLTNLDEISTEKTTSKYQEIETTVTKIENQPNTDMDLLRRYIELETKNKSIYKLEDKSETTTHNKTINLKTKENKFIAADNVELIDKLLKDYVFKKRKIPTTIEYTTTRHSLNIQNIYKRIDEIIAKGSNAHNGDDKMVENYPDKNVHSTNKYNSQYISLPQVMPPSQKGPYLTEKQLFESFYNFFSEMKQYNNSSFRALSTYEDNVYSKDKAKMDKLMKPFNQNDQKTYKAIPYTTHLETKSKSEVEQNEKTLTPNLVKEIAQTVKEVIIKDLRKEIAGIYLKTTKSTTPTIIPTTLKLTTETTPTTTSKIETHEKNMAIIDKFMDLYEQIKSLKQATFLLKANNESTTLVNYLKHPHKTPVNSAMYMPPLNRLQIPEAKIFISSIGDYNTKPLINYNSHQPRRESRHRSPITIQTNSVEIQPLAVPISKPESMIRQNIIVHSGYRHQAKNDNYLRHLNPRENKYSDIDLPIKHTDRTFKYSPMKRYVGYNSAPYPIDNLQEPKQREDVIRFRMRDNGNSKLDTDYYEKINFGNNQNGVKEIQDFFRNHNVPKFHERLEKVDTGSDGMPVVSDIDMTGKQEQSPDFPSRHQLSLVDMKKGSSYDDTHFKNFLKTQQKVTDMLERILATRPKTNTPRSVETA